MTPKDKWPTNPRSALAKLRRVQRYLESKSCAPYAVRTSAVNILLWAMTDVKLDAKQNGIILD